MAWWAVGGCRRSFSAAAGRALPGCMRRVPVGASGTIPIPRPARVGVAQGCQQISVVVLRRVHARRNRPYGHRLGGEGLKEVWPVRIEGEPPAVVSRPEGSPACGREYAQRVRLPGFDDAEGSDPLAGGRVLPVLVLENG